MTQQDFLKKFLPVIVIIALIVGLAIVFTSCSSKRGTPLGSLDDTVYLSGDGFSVSELELYQTLRHDSLGTLIRNFDKIIFADELAEIDADLEGHRDDLIKIAKRQIYGTTDDDAIEKMDATERDKKIQTFIDSFFLSGMPIALNDIETYSDTILDFYRVDLAKRINARRILEEAVVDEDSAQFISEKNIEDYFNSNHKGRFDIDAIVIRFINRAEADATLRAFGIKSYRSQFYKVPASACDIDVLSDADYTTCYNNYTINPERSDTPDIPLTEAQAFAAFIDIYNYIYTYRPDIIVDPTWDLIDGTVEDIFEDIGDDEYLNFTYDRINKMNSSLRNYVYNTLNIEGVRYTSVPRSYGNFHYLAFKVAQDDDAELDEDLTEEIREKIFENRLTDTYIQNRTQDRYKDAKIKIFDPVLDLQYSMSSQHYTRTRAESKTAVAEVNGTSILVDDFFVELEQLYGVNVAYDIAAQKILSSSHYRDLITEDEMASFKAQFNNIMGNFASNAYAQYGYPADMGRENFLMLYFRSETNAQAIEKTFIQDRLEQLYLKDYEGQYGEDFFQHLADFTEKQQDDFFSIRVNHILVYIDMDEDGNPDDPEKYLESLDAADQDQFKSDLYNFMSFLEQEIKVYSTFSTGMQTIVDNFNRSGRFIPDPAVCAVDPVVECKWAGHKSKGFLIKYESLGSINNTSALGYAKPFAERIEEIYRDEDFYSQGEFHTQWIDSVNSPYVDGSGYDNLVKTTFGYHLIVAVGGEIPRSAEFTHDDDTFLVEGDEFKIFENLKYTDIHGEDYFLNAYSDSEYPSANQIKIYLNEQQTGVQNIPTRVKPALDAYFAPVMQRIRSTEFQREMMFRLFDANNAEFTKAENNTRAAEVVEINRRQLDKYVDTSLGSDSLFAGWWEVFN